MLHRDLTRRIILGMHDVFDELGVGFIESVYESALMIALAGRGLDVRRQVPVEARYRGTVVGEFRADLIVEGLVLVELKVARTLHPTHESQVINYLRSSHLELGLLVNFGLRLHIRRLILTNDRKRRPAAALPSRASSKPT